MRDSTNHPEQFLTITNVARQLGVSPWTVRDWIKHGKLAAYKVGRSVKAPVRIRAGDVDACWSGMCPAGHRHVEMVPTTRPRQPDPPRPDFPGEAAQLRLTTFCRLAITPPTEDAAR